MILTSSVGLDVDDFTLCTICSSFIWEGDQSFNKYSILCPWLQAPQKPTWLGLGFGLIWPWGWVNIHNCPAIWPTCVLAIKLRHILVWTSEKKKKPQINRILIQAFKNNISKDITESYSPLPFGESITISLYVFWKWSIGSFATQSPKSITDQAVLHRWSQQLNPG